MSPQAYRTQMDLLATCGRLVQMVDVDALLDVDQHADQHADTVAPLVDPGAYRRSGTNLADQERFLRAAADFRAVCVQLAAAGAADLTGTAVR